MQHACHRESGISHLDFFSTWFAEAPPRDMARGELIALQQSKGRLYGAWRRDEDGLVQGLVITFAWSKWYWENFQWRVWGEEDDPSAACPRSILDLLSPVDELFAATPADFRAARRWRRRCAARLEKLDDAPPVKPGQMVVFETPVSFSDGSRHRTLRFIGRSTFRVGSTKYHIRSWREKSYEVRDAPAEDDVASVADALGI